MKFSIWKISLLLLLLLLSLSKKAWNITNWKVITAGYSKYFSGSIEKSGNNQSAIWLRGRVVAVRKGGCPDYPAATVLLPWWFCTTAAKVTNESHVTLGATWQYTNQPLRQCWWLRFGWWRRCYPAALCTWLDRQPYPWSWLLRTRVYNRKRCVCPCSTSPSLL